MERLRVYKFRIYPTKEQEIFVIKSFGCVRKDQNLMADDRMKLMKKLRMIP